MDYARAARERGSELNGASASGSWSWGEGLAGVGQLAAGVAHHFNNILQGILCSAELVRADPRVPAEQRENLSLLVEQAERGAALVRQMLDFCRLSPTFRRHLDLAGLLEREVPVLERLLNRRVQVILEAALASYVIRGDAEQIRQALVNLAANARDAMPGGGEVRIRLSRLTAREGESPPVPGQTAAATRRSTVDGTDSPMPAGEWIVLAVSDTGGGIPRELLPRIFEPFFTTKPVGRGSGMGLAQVYGVVQLHDGHIGVESEPGAGTTFRLFFPAASERGQ